MKPGIRAKLVLLSVALLLPAWWVAHAYLTSTLTEFITQEARSDLAVRGALLVQHVRSVPTPADLQEKARELAQATHTRVTLVSPSGAVQGDSGRTTAQRELMDNHAQRPEVEAALRGELGDGMRFSQTLGIPMMYLAQRAQWQDGGNVVVRLALPLHELDDVLARMRRLLLVAGLLALAVAGLMSGVVAQWASRTARSLTHTAQRMANGDLEARAPSLGADEFAELGRALNQLAAGLSLSVADLTAQRDVQATILSGMQEGVLLLDAQRRVAMVNPALRTMLLLNGDVLRQPAQSLLTEPALHALFDTVEEERVAATEEVTLQGLKPRVVLVRATPLHSPGGILAVFFDVTDLRRLESMRKDFVANASHELRTPVASIRAASEMLRQAMEKDPAAAARFVGIIERNSQRLQALVADLLDLSRIESKQFSLKPDLVDVAQVAQQILTLFRQRAEQKHMRLWTQMEGVPHAMADRRALEQVLSNLVDNATQYCPDGADISVRAAVLGEQLEVRVEDNGPGIEAQHLPRLFERFYRVDKGRSREAGGTGLGLSIVKHLVEAMGGDVQVESRVGKGTVFTFTLPLHAAPAPAVDVDAAAP